MELVVEIEHELDIEITDAELMHVATLNDVRDVVQSRMPEGSNSEEKAIQLVMSAVKKLPSKVPNEIRFDVPLLQAVDPEKWARYGGIALEHSILHYLYE